MMITIIIIIIIAEDSSRTKLRSGSAFISLGK